MACDFPAPDSPVRTTKRACAVRCATDDRLAPAISRPPVRQTSSGSATGPLSPSFSCCCRRSASALAAWCPRARSNWLRAATSTRFAMLRPGATGIRFIGTRSPRISTYWSSSPRRSYSRPLSQRSSCTTNSIRFDDRVEATPNRSLMLRMPSPRISMWWRVSSGHSPMRTDSARRRTSTASSATSRCPRSTRSSAHSLLPIPLSPAISTPRPRMSMSTACTTVRSASTSSRKLVSLAMAIGVATGVRRSGTPARSASATTSGGSACPSVTSTQGIRRAMTRARLAARTEGSCPLR